MDKRALQSYAVWAKNNLENQIEVSLKTLGINSEKDIKEARRVGEYTIIDGDSNSYPSDLKNKRDSIVRLVQTDGYKQVIEEFAYTWFNRIVALRFMEVHDFLPHGFRVLSSRTGGFEPEILKNLNFVKDELALDLSVISPLLEQGKIDEAYRYVLFRQCVALSDILPMLFDKDDSYLELLLPKALLKGETFITKLLEIDESEFLNDVEVIGWLYQFYVADDRQEFRDAKVVTKDLIPTLTQVFTPDWIVRYMAENSVGRIWMESYPDSPLRSEMRYYVDDATQEEEVQRKIEAIKYKNINPEEIRIVEPCCGSGHILVYVFDLLYKMYEEKGYQQREIPTFILKNNLVGLEIDKRAAQIASFSLVMKARSANSRFFNKTYYTVPQVHEIWDSRALLVNDYKTQLQELKILGASQIKDIEWLVETFRYGKTIGSLLKVDKKDFKSISDSIDLLDQNGVRTIFNYNFFVDGIKCLRHLVKQAEIMSAKYDVMITNPPYLGISKMEAAPKTYLQNNYPNSKADMFGMFMEAPYVKKDGFVAMVNPDSWMFLVSFEELRKSIIMKQSIVNMLHLGMGAFDATVQTTTFVIRNSEIGGNGVYYRLVDEKDKESAFLSGGGTIASLNAFNAIPSTPIAYWISDKLANTFMQGQPLSYYADAKQGLITANNNRFVRLWYEVEIGKTYFEASDYIQAFSTGAKWFPYNKGGDFRRWYGNNDYLVNWYENGKEIQSYKDGNGKLLSRPQNTQYYFRESGSWSDITVGINAFRYKPRGHIFDATGMSFFSDKYLLYLIAICNTKIVIQLLKVLSPTIHCQCGDVAKLPIIINKEKQKAVENIVLNNIEHSKMDWDSFETSWDFKKHPLI